VIPLHADLRERLFIEIDAVVPNDTSPKQVDELRPNGIVPAPVLLRAAQLELLSP
jgi:hypothetical protein